jgi:hypothetical protein
MDRQSSIILGLVILVALAAWAGVIFLIPWCQRGKFRHRLWQLRDQISDDIIEGRLPHHEAVYDLRSLVDFLVKEARQVTLANMLLSRITMARLPRDKSSYEGTSSQGLEPQQVALLEYYRKLLYRTANAHLISGSVSGWFGAVLVIPYRWITRGAVAFSRFLQANGLPTTVSRSE